MSDRYTRKDAQAAFARLASALGKTWSDRSGHLWRGKAYEPEAAGELWTRIESAGGAQNVAAVGAWMLDHNGIYGGYVIAEMFNEGGGESHPLGDLRRPARDFCDAVRFALDALACQPSDGFGRITTNWDALPGGRRG